MIMRKRILWLLTAVILCGTTAVALCSCSDNDDNPAVTTPIGDKIVGKWYAETPKQVTLAKADAEKEAEIRKKLKELIANVNSGDAGIGYGGPGNGSAHARRLGDI